MAVAGLVALLSRSGNRIVVFAVGVVAAVGGHGLLFVGYGLDRVVFWQDVVYVNSTDRQVVVYYAYEAEPLRSKYLLESGEESKDLLGFRRDGPGLRFVALDASGSTAPLRQMSMQEYSALFPWDINRDDEYRYSVRKVFDRTYSWDELRQLNDSVVLTNSSASP